LHTKKQRMMKEIQHKRKKMIDCAQKHGLTSERTIRYSQELDMLLNEYQRTFQSSTLQEKVKTPRKRMMLICPLTLIYKRSKLRANA
jgi:stage 0 sporulation regulatory protein